MDERKFIKSRIEFESILPKALVLGSSRIMQIDSQTIGTTLLNFGVSGSSVEDDVAIWKLASRKFKPSLVLISADPWLFNAKSGQGRWQSLEKEYYLALYDLGIDIEKPSIAFLSKSDNNLLFNLYKFTNFSKISVEDDIPGDVDKIRRDGSRVYNLSYANKSNDEIESNAISFASYAMSPYEWSSSAKDIFEKLILQIKKEHNVALVLSPYHPKLYKFMVSQDKKFIEIEKEFRNLSTKLGIPIIGSYNPEQIGCSSCEFYDGMHPKSSCMSKIVKQLK